MPDGQHLRLQGFGDLGNFEESKNINFSKEEDKVKKEDKKPGREEYYATYRYHKVGGMW